MDQATGVRLNKPHRTGDAHRGSQVIPEGALVVKAALLEEEHDFGAVEVLST